VVLPETLIFSGWTDSNLRLLKVGEGLPSNKRATRAQVASRSRGWGMDVGRGVEIVVDVACHGFKVGNWYG
jgi:hypothetical protein